MARWELSRLVIGETRSMASRCARLPSPVHDLDGLAGTGIAGVTEHGDLEPTDLVVPVETRTLLRQGLTPAA